MGLRVNFTLSDISRCAFLSFFVLLGFSSVAQMAGPACATYPIVNTPIVGDPNGGPCGVDVPHYIVDLTNNADSNWVSPSGPRFGDAEDRCNTCCDADPAPNDNERCVSFELTLHPNAAGIRFYIASGAPPSGSLGWRLMFPGSGTCGVENPADIDVCLDGPGPHYISFCKPGNNPNSYGIQSFGTPGAGPTDIVSDACDGLLYGIGYDEATVTWQSVIPGADGDYDSFLSSTAGDDSVIVTFVPGAPDTVYYEICGAAVGVDAATCGLTNVCDTTAVEFIQTLQVDIQPDDPVICFGSTVGVTLTAVDSGGKAPILYDWQPTNETTQNIQAFTVGWNYVTVSDNSGCPTASDSVYVDAYTLPILADAGNDTISCVNNPNMQLNGSVQVAAGGIWTVLPGASGTGDGTFDDDTLLNATYFPGPNDLANPGICIQMVLTTTGNATCPADADTMCLVIDPTPAVDAGLGSEICSNGGCFALVGTSSTGSGTWSGGTGTFTSVNSLTTNYCPSVAEINTAESSGLPLDVTLYLSTTNNNACLPVIDSIIITIVPAPVVDAGPDSSLCSNNAVFVTNGSVVDPDGNVGSGTWSTSGDGSFTSVNSFNATYTPGPNDLSLGSVNLTFTSTSNTSGGGAVCSAVSDVMTLTFTPAPTLSIGADRQVCANNDLVSGLAATFTVATGVTWTGGTGVYSNPNGTPTNFNPTDGLAPTTMTLIATTTGNGACNAVSDSLVLTITTAPTINFEVPARVCSNDPEICITNTTLQNATGVFWYTAGGGTSFTASNTSLNPCYMPTASEISPNQSVVLFAQTTGVGNCAPVTKDTVIIIFPAPVVNAGPNDTVCANNAVASLSGTSTSGTTTWTTSGDGGFGGTQGSLNATYTAGSNDLLNGSVTLTLTSVLNVPGFVTCNAVSDNMTLYFSPSPTANAGPNQTRCANNPIVTTAGAVTIATGGTWTALGDGSFNGTQNNLAATYTPGTQDLIDTNVCLVLTTTGNGNCNAVSDTMCTIFTPAPVVDAGPPQNICSNNLCDISLSGTVTVATGGTWTTSGMGTFSPSAALLSTAYCPPASDTLLSPLDFILTSTGNSNCNPVSDTIPVTFTPSPTVSATTDTVCANNSQATVSAVINGVAAGVQWSGGLGTIGSATSLTTTYNPSNSEITAGVATLFVQTTGHGNCNSGRDTIRITITPSPIADAGGNQTVCANNNVVTLAGSVTNATGGTWTTLGDGGFGGTQNLLAATYTPGANDITNGVVSLVLQTTGIGNCNPTFDTMRVTITPAPTVEAGPNDIVCANSSVANLTGSVTVASGGVWSGGGGTYSSSASDLTLTYVPTAAEITAGSVTLTLTTTGNGNCLSVSDQATITINPAPTVNAGGDVTVCADAPAVSLNGVVTVATGGIWTGGGGSYSPNNTTLVTTYIPSPTEIANGTARLILITTGNGLCSPVSDTMNITIVPAPTVDAGPSQTVCGNLNAVAINGAATNAAGATVTWTSSGTGSFANANTLSTSYTPTSADTAAGSVLLTLTLSGAGGGLCNTITDTVSLTFDPTPNVSVGGDLNVCTNEYPVQLNAFGNTGNWTSSSGNAAGFSPNTGAQNATYTPSATDETNGTVTLTYTSTPFGTCPVASDNLILTIIPGPTVNAGPDQTECADIGVFNLSGTIGGTATGGQWVTSGTPGTIASGTSLNTTYTPSAQDISNGGVQLILFATGTGICPVTSDTLNIVITPAPTIDAGFPQTVCADAGTITLDGTVTVAGGATWTSSSAGTFVDPNLVDPVYNIHPNDTVNGTVTLTITSTNNGSCNPVSDNVVITITPAPTIDAGPDATICADANSYTLDGSFTVASGIVWSTAGTGTFSPSTVDPNANYFPSDADTLNRTVTFLLNTVGTGTCIPLADTMILTITPAPTITVGADITICADQPTVSPSAVITTASGVTWVSTGNGLFNNANILSPTYTLGGADTSLVTLTATTTGNGLCNAVSDQMNVFVTPRVTVSAGPNQALCADASSISLNGAVTVATGGTWTILSGSGVIANPNALVTTYSPSAADTAAGCISLILTSTGNGLCQPVSDTVDICFSPIPIVDAGSDITVCADTAFVQMTGTIFNAGGGVWSTNGSGLFFPNPNDLAAQYEPGATDTSGNYTIYLTSTGNGICSAIVDSMILTITPVPTINIGPDQTICADNNVVSLTATITVAGNVSWTTSGSGSFTANPSITTDYNVHPNDTLAGTVNIIGTTTGNGMCKAYTDQMTVNITPAPTVDAGLDRDICGDQTSIVLNGSVSVATGGVWSTPNGTGTFSSTTTLTGATYNISSTDSANGGFDIILTTTGNGTCNPVSDTIRINIQHVPVVTAGPDITVCADTSSIQLTSVYSVAAGIEWTTSGQGGFAPNQFDSTALYIPGGTDVANGGVTITLTTTGNGICPAQTDQMNIIITPAPVAAAGPDQTVCADGTTINLNGSVTVTGTGIWSTGNGTGTFSASNTDLGGTFTPSASQVTAGIAVVTLTSTNNGSCNPVTDNFTLTITPAPVVNAGNNVSICGSTGSIALNGTVTNATGGTWTTLGSGTFSNANTLSTTYTYSNADSINGNVTLVLTSTGNGLCNPVRDSVRLTIRPVPTIAATPDTVCGDINFNIPLSATFTNAGGMIWSTLVGQGTFIPGVTFTSVDYDPVAADLGNSPFVIYASTTGNGVCPAAIDSAIISIRTTPTVNAGPDVLVCANQAMPIALSGTFTNATGVRWTSANLGTFTAPTSASSPANTGYTISATDISFGGGTIFLTTTNNGLCPAVVDQLNLIVTPTPTIEAGPRDTICADHDTIYLNATVTTASGGAWTTSGDGTFGNANALSTYYLLGTNDSTNGGSIILTVQSTGNGTCVPVSDSKTILITPAPTLNVLDTLTFCEDFTQVAFTAIYSVATQGTWSSNSNGVFTPNTTNTNVYYNLGSTDTSGSSFTVYFTTAPINGCYAYTDSATANITEAPTVDVGDANVCASVDTVPLAGSFTVATGISWYTTNGTGTFAPDSLTPITGYVPSAGDKAGGVPIEIIIQTEGNGSCNTRFDTISVSISDPIVVNAGVNDTVCADTAGFPLDGTFANSDSAMWSTLGDGTFIDQFDTNTVYVPGPTDISSGSAILVLESVGNGFCEAEFDTLVLTITPAPTVSINTVSTCTDRDTLFLSSTFTVSTGLLWTTTGDGLFIPGNTNPTSTLDNPDYEIGATDKITTTFTIFVETTGNGLCKVVRDTLPVELIPAPTAEAGLDTSICSDADSLPLNGSVFVSGGGGGIWSTTGNGTFDDATSLATTYFFGNQDTIGGSVTLYLTTTGGTCSPVTDSLVVTYTPAPTVDAGGESVCIDNPAIPLTGTFTVATGVLWSTIGGDGNFVPANAAVTTYNTGANDIIKDSVVFVLETTGNGSCKIYYDTMVVHLDPGPLAIIQVDTVCADGVEIDLTGLGTSTTGFAAWTTTGDGAFSVDTIDGGMYQFGPVDTTSGFVDLILTTTFNGDCEPHADTARFVIDPAPIVNARNNFQVCGDTNAFPLSGTVMHASGGVWSTFDGNNGNIASPTSLITSYTLEDADRTRGFVSFVLESTGNGRCNPVRDTMVVTITTVPTVDAGDGLICADVPNLQLNGTITTATGGVWTTPNGSGNFAPNPNFIDAVYQQDPVLDPAASPILLILTTTGNGLCKAYSDTVQLIITDPPSVEAGPSMAVCNDQDTICLSGSFQIDNAATWTINGGSGSLTPNNTDTSSCYVLGATDTAGTSFTLYYTTNGSSGCIPVTDSMTISISQGPTVDAGLPDTICADANQVSLHGTYTISGGVEWSSLTGGSFSPTENDTIATYNISSLDSLNGGATIYLTTIFNGTCLPVVDSVIMVINPTPTADAGIDHTICADSAGIQITGIIQVATGGIWSTTGSGTFNPSNTSIVVTYEPSIADTSSSPIVLTLTTTGNGLCNPVFDNMTLNITPAPTVDAGFDKTVCADADSVPVSGAVTIATGGQWTSLGGAGTGTFTNPTSLNTAFILGTTDLAAGFVDLVLTTTGSGSCNEISDTVRLNITDSVTLTVSNDTTICQDADDIFLISSITVASGVIWTSTGTGTFSPSIVSDSILYDFSPADTTQSSITLTVSSTGNGTCKSQTDSVVVTFDPLPIANAGFNQTVCADAPVVTLAGFVTNAPGGTWSTTGTGTFGLATDLGTTYTASNGDTAIGLVNIFLTTDLIGTCSPDVDVMLITINPAPTVDAGLDQEWCQDVNGIQLDGEFTTATGVIWSTSGDGTFVADPTDANAIYQRGSNDIINGTVTLTLCTTGNGLCNPVCDSMVYTITPGPSVNAGPNDTLCADAGEVVLLGSTYDGMPTSNLLWTTTTSGTFSNTSATSLSPTWTPDPSVVPVGNVPPLVVTFNLENQQSGTCNPVSDQRVVVFNPIPTIDLGADDTVCVDVDTIYLSANLTNAASVSWTSSGTGTFPNGNAGLNVEYVPSVSDRNLNAILFTGETVGTDLCLDYTDQVLVVFRERPTVDAGVDQTVCANSGVINLSGAVTLASGGSWNILTGNGSFTPSNTDLLGGYVTVPSDTVGNGPVILTLTSRPYMDCKQYKDTMRIDFDPEPTVSAGDASFCADVSGFQLNGSATNAFGVLWSTSGDGAFFSPTDLMPFYVPGANDQANAFARLYITAVTGNTCPNITDSIDVTIIPLPIANGGLDVTICRGGTTTLIAQIDPQTDYQWYTVGGVPIDVMNPIITVSANQDTMFVLEATDQIYTNCSTYDTVRVSVYDPPSLNLPPHYCLVDGLIIDANPIPDTLQSSYQWYERVPPNLYDVGTPTTSIEESGIYIFAFIYDQCQVFDTTEVTDPPEVDIEDKIVCIGQSVSLEATSPTGVVYDWIEEVTGDTVAFNTNPVIVTADNDTINDQYFIAKVTDALGCVSLDTVALTKLPPPQMTLEDQPVCIGDLVTLNATPSNVIDSLLPDAQFNWWYQGDSISGEHDSTLSVFTAGEYVVEFGIGECKALDTSQVDFNPLPVPDMRQKYDHCFDYITDLTINAGTASAYLWEATQNTDSTEIVTEYGDYVVTVFNEFDCQANDTIEIVEVCEPKVFPPTGFIPNGGPCDPSCVDNDCNNCFFIKGAHYRNWNLTVYNRWGEIIFHSTNPDAEDGSGMWDGTYKGELMPAGVYPWILYYEGDTPDYFGPYHLEGKITLIR